MESKGDQRKRLTTSRLVGGGFDKQKILYRRLVLGCCKMSKSPHLTTRILKVYIEALTEFSHMYHPDDLSNTLLSQVTPSVGIGAECTFQGQGKGREDSNCSGPVPGSTTGHVLSMTAPNRDPHPPSTINTLVLTDLHGALSQCIGEH